ncbi:hypothetical protein VI08_11705 [Luteibacter yeojuensis]|uniref:Uncharacterized protein n=2 Tax=Luteibacter yeojuensis TaxID=345309 RepID=A0A0F3KPU4_9GAMM|nr:hypothetical protein VI08_11705 [Luteibacter yeojuensis]
MPPDPIHLADPAIGHHAPLDARVSKLETAMDYVRDDIRNLRLELRDTRNELRGEIHDVRTDVRLVLGSLITVGLGLAGMMAKGFHWL